MGVFKNIRKLICPNVRGNVRPDDFDDGGETPPGPAHDDSLLLESGDYLLLESGDTILLE